MRTRKLTAMEKRILPQLLSDGTDVVYYRGSCHIRSLGLINTYISLQTLLALHSRGYLSWECGEYRPMGKWLVCQWAQFKVSFTARKLYKYLQTYGGLPAHEFLRGSTSERDFMRIDRGITS